jgi:glycyl-tRNA synthetase
MICFAIGFCRERDTTVQLIGKTDEVIELVKELCSGAIDWAEGSKRLPAYTGEQEV